MSSNVIAKNQTLIGFNDFNVNIQNVQQSV